MNKILELLSLESQDISTQFKKASVEGRGTPQEISDRREDVLSSFLKRYFPFPYRIAKGNIIDSFGLESASIDVVLLNPAHPYITSNEPKFSAILVDGVDLAIELKPELKSDIEIHRSLKQIISVKKLKKVISGIAPTIGITTNGEVERFRRIPCVIFADSTYSNVDLLLKKIIDYYVENNIPRVLQFDLIIINNEYVIFNSSEANYINIEHKGIGQLKTKEFTLAFFIYLINKFPSSQANLFNSKKVLEHYLDSDGSNEFYMDRKECLNVELIKLPLFDFEFDYTEIHRKTL